MIKEYYEIWCITKEGDRMLKDEISDYEMAIQKTRKLAMEIKNCKYMEILKKRQEYFKIINDHN